MQIRIIFPAIVALISLSACAQNRTSTTTAVPPNDATATRTTRVIDTQIGQDVIPNAPPKDQYSDAQVNNYPDQYGPTDRYNDGARRHIRVRAPFVNLNIDRDSGSVHLNSPFVRVDKSGRGQHTDVDVPGPQAESQSAPPADWTNAPAK